MLATDCNELHSALKRKSETKAVSDMRPATAPNTAPPVILAPMVCGSELAFRMLCRAHGASETWSPMLRAADVIKKATAARKLKRSSVCLADVDTASCAPSLDTSPGSAAACPMTTNDRLFLPDTCALDKPNLVVQLCGSDPDELERAATAILQTYPGLKGIDLNLGCPQPAADKEHFGAFLVERDPDLAVACVRALVRAADAYAQANQQDVLLESLSPLPNRRARISAKMRLLDDAKFGIAFAQRLVTEGGLEMLTVHCRYRTDKHNGPANLMAGRALVEALDIPVIINGGVSSGTDARHIIDVTGAAGVMSARGFLRNPRMLSASFSLSGGMIKAREEDENPAYLAAEYLDFCKEYPPPSAMYIRKHLRWIFRVELQPTEKEAGKEVYRDPVRGWRARLWTFLVRPYINSLQQFRALVGLYCVLAKVDPMPRTIVCMSPEVFSFKAIRNLY